MNTPNRHPGTTFADRPWWILLIILTALWALFARPLAPLEETRAAGVAWEMWLRGDFLVPHINGEPYSHKPPLLFWLMHIGWAVFGVNDWWPRLVGPLATLAATVLTWRLAAELRPDDQRYRQLAAWMTVGTLGWLLYGQMLMYDALLTATVVLALIGLWRAGDGGTGRGWLLVAAGIGLGILAKGPVALLHILVPAVLGPLWSDAARRQPLAWYGRLLLGLIGGLFTAGIWAGLAAINGGDEYARMILLEQTSGRVVDSFAHERPWWVYLAFMPALLIPWIFLPGTWRSLFRGPTSAPRKFLFSWALGCLVALSLVSGKQPHYAVPEIPAFMLLVAGGLSAGHTTRRIALGAISFVFAMLLLGSAVMWKAYPEFDMAPAGRLTHALQENDIPVSVVTQYRNQLAFPGRLTEPLAEIRESQVPGWLEQHPDGVVITFSRDLSPEIGLEIVRSFPYRRGALNFQALPGNERAGTVMGQAEGTRAEVDEA
jgi:4-amino-4-deoxy-L-arabinose transferase-like glycosyltransferase